MRSESINELAEALSKFQAESPKISKSSIAKIPMKTGGKYEFKYADLAEIMESVTPVMARCGLSISQSTTMDVGNGLLLVTMLMHKSGQWISGEYPLKLHDRAQDMGGEITYARRYTVTAILGVQADDFDSGDQTHAANHVAKTETQNAVVNQVKAAVKNYAPQSEPIKGNPNEPYNESHSDPDVAVELAKLAAYKIPFGKFTGKTMREVGPLDAGKYIEWAEADAKTRQKPLPHNFTEFRTMYELLMKCMKTN